LLSLKVFSGDFCLRMRLAFFPSLYLSNSAPVI